MVTYIEKTITGTITHGTTSITFTDDFITNESIIDVYFEDDDIIPTEQSQSGNTLTISIESQSNDVDVAVHITNADTIDYEDIIESHTNELTLLDAKVDGLNASNINYDEHSTLYSAMGDIDELETTSKNIVGAVNECFQSVSSGKSLIASAITDKGVPTLANDTFETMANNISQIESGGGGTVDVPYVMSTRGYLGTIVTGTPNQCYWQQESGSGHDCPIIDLRQFKNKYGVLSIKFPITTNRTRAVIGNDATPVVGRGYDVLSFNDSGTTTNNYVLNVTKDYVYIYGYTSVSPSHALEYCKFTEITL